LEDRERERRNKWGSSERHYILGGVRKKETIFPVLKVPRQCPLVLLVETAHMIGIIFFLRTNSLSSFDMARTAQKTKNLGGKQTQTAR
jgi:hypothetical protein